LYFSPATGQLLQLNVGLVDTKELFAGEMSCGTHFVGGIGVAVGSIGVGVLVGGAMIVTPVPVADRRLSVETFSTTTLVSIVLFTIALKLKFAGPARDFAVKCNVANVNVAV